MAAKKAVRSGSSAKDAKAPKTAKAQSAAKAAASVAPSGPPAKIADVLRLLAQAIPEPYCELDHASPFQLLIATILSAQSTDKIVNTVTPVLFAKWLTPRDLAAAARAEVEEVVHKTGFFRNKAKAIQECSLLLCERHGGEVPKSMDELTALPGVARKTANVVLGTAHRIALGIATDTHVMRVSQRLGLTTATKPEAIEQDLCRAIPQAEWTDGGHRILLHGRYVCLAKAPRCADCPLAEICPSCEGAPVGPVAERAKNERAVVERRGSKA